MQYFLVKRPKIVFETRLVEAKDATTAMMPADGGRLLHEQAEEPTRRVENMTATPYVGDLNLDGELFRVEKMERHAVTVFVKAKDLDDAIKKVTDGEEGEECHGSEYVETMESDTWNAFDNKGKQVL